MFKWQKTRLWDPNLGGWQHLGRQLRKGQKTWEGNRNMDQRGCVGRRVRKWHQVRAWSLALGANQVRIDRYLQHRHHERRGCHEVGRWPGVEGVLERRQATWQEL